MKAKLFLFLLIISGFSGCRKLINIDSDYVGVWRGGYYGSRYYKLNITEDGGAEYERKFQGGGPSQYGYERWYGPLKSNGRRFQIAYSSPWFIIIENPVLTNDDCRSLFFSSDSTYLKNNWRIKFKYPKTIGYDGAEVVMYRHQF
ncbi:MAG: hypothetical protein V4615_10365 [Bacteroidota bacterium]